MFDPVASFARKIARFPAQILVRLRIPPDAVTVGGLVFHCAIAFWIATERATPFLGGALILLAGFLDTLDGSVAKLSGKATLFGEYLDSVVDRISDAVLLFGILVLFLRQGREAHAIAAAAALGAVPLVSYTRTKAEALGLKCEVGFMTRALRVMILGVGFYAGWIFPAMVILTAGSLITASHRIGHVWKLTRKRIGGRA